MTYNDTFFEETNNFFIKGKLDTLILMQTKVLEFSKKNLLATNNVEQKSHCNCFLHLLAKIRVNLESVNSLIPFLYNDYRFKASVNLIYRSITEDLITLYYLFGFVKLDDPEQISLNNELMIFHKEYLLSSLKGVEADIEFNELISAYQSEPVPERPNFFNEIIEKNPEMIDSDGIWRLNKDIRATTSPVFNQFLIDDKTGRKGFISVETKINFLKRRGFETNLRLNSLYKYFSQYQHYSPKVIDFVNADLDYDIITYQDVIDNVLVAIHQLYEIINYNDKEILMEEWEQLSSVVFSRFHD